MRPSLKHLLLLAPLAFLLGSCGSKKTTVFIPKDADMVMHINMASLRSKLSWDEIKSAEWFKMLSDKAEEEDELTPLQKSILDNPEKSGVDFKNDIYFFYQVRGKHAYAVGVGQLSDAKKFEETIQSVSEMLRINKKGGISYVGSEDGCLTWTKNRFIFVAPSAAPDTDFGPSRRYDYDDEEDERRGVTLDSLLNYATHIYDLKQSSSISSNSRFSSLMKESGDMHMFFNNSGLMRNSMGPLRMLKASSLLEENVAGLSISFDNGKVTVNSKSWYGKELTALLKKYQPGNLNTDMLKRIPSQNLAAVIALNYPPEGIKEFIKTLGAEGIVNGFLSKSGLTIDDIVKANKGDVMLAVSDFTIQQKKITSESMMEGEEPYSYTTTKPDANILFATSINDKTSFEKLMGVIKTEINKSGDAARDTAQLKYTLNDKWFVMGNKQSLVDSFAAGSNTNSAALINQISGHPMGGFIDLQKIFAGIPTSAEMGPLGRMEHKMLATISQNWDNIIFYGGEMKDGATIGHFEINLKDKSTNSLKQLYTFMGKMVDEQRKEKLRYWNEEMETAPVVIDTPIVEPKIQDKNK